MGLTAEQIDAAFAAVDNSEKRCRLGHILKEHPALESRVMDVSRYDGATIARILKGLGLEVSKDTVNKHRKGICLCTGRNKR